jgi:hypothetical protein
MAATRRDPAQAAVIEHLKNKASPATTTERQRIDSVIMSHTAQSVARLFAWQGRFCNVICGTGIRLLRTVNSTVGIRAALCCNDHGPQWRASTTTPISFHRRPVIGRPWLWRSSNLPWRTVESGGRHQVRVNEIGATEEHNFHC